MDYIFHSKMKRVVYEFIWVVVSESHTLFTPSLSIRIGDCKEREVGYISKGCLEEATHNLTHFRGLTTLEFI